MFGFGRAPDGMVSEIEVLRRLQRQVGEEEQSTLAFYMQSMSSALRRFRNDLSVANVRRRYVLFRLWTAHKALFQELLTNLEVGLRAGKLNEAGVIVVEDLRKAMEWRWIGYGPAPNIDRLLWDWHEFAEGRLLIRRDRPLTRKLPHSYIPNVLVNYDVNADIFFLPEEEIKQTHGSDLTFGVEQDSTTGRGRSDISRHGLSAMYAPSLLGPPLR